MKLVMDEKLKHRLIGLAVIISIGAIFAPAVVRKSGQRVENTYTVNVKLPPKPVAPEVAATDEKELFKTIKVARVHLPPVSADKSANPMVKAAPIKSEEVAVNTESQLTKIVTEVKPQVTHEALQESAALTANNAVTVASNHMQTAKRVASIPKTAVTAVKKAPVKPVQFANKVKSKAVYAVQLASFSQLVNAQSLVTRLQHKGYKASYVKIATRNGPVYKVYAGHSPSKTEALKMKTQLASSMQLNGFVVTAGVS